MRYVLFTILLFAIAGCSGKAEERKAQLEAQCLTADWRAIGYEDGAKGWKTDRISKHRKACAEFGVTPDFDAYMGGHGEGIAYYCQPRTGYNAGVKGRRYNGGCPPAQEAAYQAANADGYGLWERERAVSDTAGRLGSARQRASDIELIVTDKSKLLLSPTVPMADRVTIGIEIKQLVQEKRDLNRAIPGLEANHAAAQHDLAAYRASLAGRYSS